MATDNRQTRLGELLRTLRRRHNMSLRELAEKIGVDHSHLSRIESGKVMPKYDLIYKLATVLKAPELYIAAGYIPPMLYPPERNLLQNDDKKIFYEQPLLPFNDSYKPPEDPMLPYLRQARDIEGMHFVFHTPYEYVTFWASRGIGDARLTHIPPVRGELIAAGSYVPPYYSKEAAQGYEAGFINGVDRVVTLLREIFHNHKDGRYWLLAAMSVPPDEARLLADVCDRLRALKCDPDAAEVILAVLCAWARRAEREKASRDVNQEEGGEGDGTVEVSSDGSDH
ncbi:MAG: Helix-turn-helix domain [Moorella sp. (in: firmicutes)]|jgi:transcriptional regulator with XRE-family HTH domain|nr:Helix-turn-helix domain [Moorella sp. (in: firmicutes)]